MSPRLESGGGFEVQEILEIRSERIMQGARGKRRKGRAWGRKRRGR